MTALAGIKVVDLSRVLAGPWASQTLGDLGATVIKVERPGHGDDTRGWGPPYLEDHEQQPSSESAYFLSANRNKQSVTIDVAQPEGQELIRRLVRDADVVIENFKVGSLARYGLDYRRLADLNPRIVYCSITGFGQTGPYAARPGYDVLLQAMGGLMSVTGAADGTAGAGPQKVGVAVVDLLAGLYATVGILAALAAREKSGSGQHIDLALLDVEVACLANQAMNYLVTGTSPTRMGNAHPNIVPYQDFPTADGAIIVAVGNDAQYERFATAIGCPALASDGRYRTNAERVANRAALIPLISGVTSGQTTRHWINALEAANVPCGPVNTIADVFADPQVVARGLGMTLEHPAGPCPGVRSPLRMSDTPVEYRRPPPTLGEHTDEILRSHLGLSHAEVNELRAKGVV